MEERIDSGLVPQIDLISMLKDIAKEWWAILLLSLAVALFADIWVNATYQPEYKTSTTFVVTAKGMNTNVYQNLNSTQQLAQQFTEILDSNVLKKKVAQDLNMSSLNIDSSVDLVPETNLITLSVKAGTAVESYRILQSIMKNYNTVSDYAIKNVIIETIQSPAVSMAPVNPLNEKKTMVIAFIAAVAVLMVLVAGISYLRDTIKNPKDVTSKLDTRLLGSIYHEMHVKDMIQGLKETVCTTASIMLIVSAASVFSWILTKERIPQALTAWMLANINSKYVFLIVVNIFLLIVGMFIEGNASMIILVPLLAPIAAQYGITAI